MPLDLHGVVGPQINLSFSALSASLDDELKLHANHLVLKLKEGLLRLRSVEWMRPAVSPEVIYRKWGVLDLWQYLSYVLSEMTVVKVAGWCT